MLRCLQVEAFRDASRIGPPTLTLEYTEREVSQFAVDPSYATPTVKVAVCDRSVTIRTTYTGTSL